MNSHTNELSVPLLWKFSVNLLGFSAGSCRTSLECCSLGNVITPGCFIFLPISGGTGWNNQVLTLKELSHMPVRAEGLSLQKDSISWVSSWFTSIPLPKPWNSEFTLVLCFSVHRTTTSNSANTPFLYRYSLPAVFYVESINKRLVTKEIMLGESIDLRLLKFISCFI